VSSIKKQNRVKKEKRYREGLCCLVFRRTSPERNPSMLDARHLLGSIGLLSILASPWAAVAASPTCKDILVGKSYNCQSISDLGPNAFCVRFIAPGSVSVNFDASVLGGTFGCSCSPLGTPLRPKFNRSHQFNCVGLEGGSLPTDFLGVVVEKGKKIRRARLTSQTGEAAIVACDLASSSCL
jgi:hypothetical protein